MLISPLWPSSLLLTAALAQAQTPACPNNLRTTYPAPVPADGWHARVVANKEMKQPRSILFDTEGALLVLDQNVGVLRMTLEDHGGSCVVVKNVTSVVRDENLNHGLQLSPDGKTLYVSTSDAVYAYQYDAPSGSTFGQPRTLVTGMDNDMHKSRTLFLTSAGDLLVSRGSAANADILARDKASGHCQIRSFDTSQLTNFTSGRVVGWGLRNSVGVGEHPNGGIWSVENGVDNLQRQGQDIHNTNPGEELNYHGTVGNYTGNNFGYPLCHTLWDTNSFPSLGGLRTGDNFAVEVAEEERVAAITDDQCNSESERATLPLPPHTAPLDIKFDEKGDYAYISLHGSWNSDPPVGYALVRVPFENGRPKASRDSKDGYEEIVKSPDLSKCPRQCFRPVGLAWDKKGRLFLASDTTKEIFVVAKVNGTEGEGDKSAARGRETGWWRVGAAVAVAGVGAWLV